MTTTTTCKRHKAIETRTVGFTHCVSRNCNPAAHGGVCHVETCKCGATRKTNSTGFGREEKGKWESQ